MPLKEVKVGLDERTHRVLLRIARSRGIHLNELVREITDGYVEAEVHRAKVVLGQDADNPAWTDSDGIGTESHRFSRMQREPRGGRR